MSIDIAKLKALAEAAKNDCGDYMALNDYGMAVPPAVVLELIGRLEVSESMEGLYTSTVTVERAELEQTKRELDQIKAESDTSAWQPLEATGQIKQGDWLSFTVAGSFFCVQAKLIIDPGTEKEEIVYNRQKNHYFVTSMAVDGTSTHKGVLVARQKNG